jgi:CubicO group peptidase (beta-lactamase class C family)
MSAHDWNATAPPEVTGFDPGRLQRARDLCAHAVESGQVQGIALAVARGGRLALNEAWGATGRPRRPAATDTVWLTASVTKPVVCTAVCLLAERGQLGLEDRVTRFLPEFDLPDRRETTLRHLLTHTSGLPDMLPENLDLRRRHAPLPEFVKRIYETPLLFPPGTSVSYQSTGIALLGEIIERVSGASCRDFLRHEFFEPLGMTGSALGWRPELEERVAECELEGEPSDWDWNTPYWRDFGAPWGGMFATAPDMARFLQMLQGEGEWEGRRVLGKATVRTMTRDHTAELPDLPTAERKKGSWGLGWRVAAVRNAEWLGDLTSLRTYGHIGATGTCAWNDPDSGISFVFFSNKPGIWRLSGLVSNAVAAAAL